MNAKGCADIPDRKPPPIFETEENSMSNYSEHRLETEYQEYRRESNEHVRALNDGTFGQPVSNRSPEEQAEWERNFREWNYGRGKKETNRQADEKRERVA